MEKYSKAAASKEETVNTKITKIVQEIEPALYEDAPKKENTRSNSQEKLVRKYPKNWAMEETDQEESFSGRILEKL
jgi:hypothetical protein